MRHAIGGNPVAAANRSEAGPRARPAELVPAMAGDTKWKSRYNGPAKGDDGGTSVAVSADGSTVFVTGGGTGTLAATTTPRWPTARRPARPDGRSPTTARATGSTRRPLSAGGLQRLYNGPADNTDDANAIAVSPDASMVLVTGASIATCGASAYATVAYDASTGAELLGEAIRWRRARQRLRVCPGNPFRWIRRVRYRREHRLDGFLRLRHAGVPPALIKASRGGAQTRAWLRPGRPCRRRR